jgi:hypothetical protein
MRLQKQMTWLPACGKGRTVSPLTNYQQLIRRSHVADEVDVDVEEAVCVWVCVCVAVAVAVAVCVCVCVDEDDEVGVEVEVLVDELVADDVALKGIQNV